jgi:hypothetical protein
MARAIAAGGFKLERGEENDLASKIVSFPSCPFVTFAQNPSSREAYLVV